MHETPANSPTTLDISRSVHQALPETQALCEPWFGQASLAVSPSKMHFKVQVINDPGHGLVRLFEMFRIDKRGLRGMIEHDTAPVHFPLFSGKSAFLKSDGDSGAGIDAFHACVYNLGIDGAKAVATDAAFIEAMAAIHEKLVPVLVEDLPVPDFIVRFDRPYTVFFLPRVNGSVDGAVGAISTAIHRLQGHLLVEARDEDEVREAFCTRVSGFPVKMIGTIAAPGGNNEARCLVILKRAA